jgi:type IV secretion system protein VirB10
MPSREDFRQLELDDAAASRLVQSRGSVSSSIIVLAGVVVIAFIGWILWSSRTSIQKTMLTPDADEFRTTQYQPPIINTPPAATNQGKLVITPPPPPPALVAAPPAPPPVDAGGSFPALNPPGVVSPPPPLAPPNDDTARRLAEEERLKWERLKSPMMVMDGGGGNIGVGEKSSDTPGRSQVAYEETDANRRFLNAASAGGVEISQAIKNKRIDALIPQGTMIRGVLETAIQSDLPGMVRAVTSEDVWSFDGRRVIVPAGSRLIGEYKSGLATGQTRVFIVWTRILRSDGVSVQLGSYGTDDLGRSGLTGEVDKHYFERFGAAIMLSVIGGGAQYIGNLGTNQSNNQQTSTSTFDPATGLTTTTTTSPNQNDQYARQIAAQNASQTITQLANEALKNSINIPPTIHVDQGARIMVFVRRDLDFSSLYPDPVKEMIKELRSGNRHASFDDAAAAYRPPIQGSPTLGGLVRKP